MSSELHRLNQWYLNALRSQALKDVGEACLMFGVDKAYADTVANLSTEEIEAISLSGRTLFSPCVSIDELVALKEVPPAMRSVLGELAQGADHGRV